MKRTTHFLNRFVLQQSAHTPARTNSQIPFKEAAVIIPLIQRNDEWFVLFTQRSWQLRHHPGQICFPGEFSVTIQTDRSLSEIVFIALFHQVNYW